MEKNVNPEIQKIADKIKYIKTAMLVTMEEDGCLRSRPMQTLQVEGTDLLFLTGYASGKTHEIKNDSHVNVTYADEGKKVYVSVSGRAMISKDRQKIEELWTEAFKAWFPGGKDDPNIALIRVNVEKAEYWDSPSGLVAQTFALGKALVTGRPPVEMGEHEKVKLAA